MFIFSGEINSSGNGRNASDSANAGCILIMIRHRHGRIRKCFFIAAKLLQTHDQWPQAMAPGLTASWQLVGNQGHDWHPFPWDKIAGGLIVVTMYLASALFVGAQAWARQSPRVKAVKRPYPCLVHNSLNMGAGLHAMSPKQWRVVAQSNREINRRNNLKYLLVKRPDKNHKLPSWQLGDGHTHPIQCPYRYLDGYLIRHDP